MLPSNFYHPAYIPVLIAAVAVVAAAAGWALPFYRQALRVETASRLTPLDGLRGLLCFAVMMHHAGVVRMYVQTGRWQVPPTSTHLELGSAAVGFFFCVTGFLFWTRVLADPQRLEPGPFLRARLFRVGPMYFISAAAALAVAGPEVRWFSLETVHGLLRMLPIGLCTWGAVGSHAPPGAMRIGWVDANVTWTLQYEWAFYLTLPALAACVSAGKERRLLLAAVALVLLAGADWTLFFVSGMVASHAARHPQVSAALRHPLAAVVAIGAVAALPRLAPLGQGAGEKLLITVAFLPMACGNSLFGLLNLSGLRVMGIVSYSVYLMHGIVLWAARPAMRPWADDGPGDAAHFWALTIALAVAVLAISLVTFRWVEHPAIAFEKSLRRRGPATDRAVLSAVAPEPTVTAPAV